MYMMLYKELEDKLASRRLESRKKAQGRHGEKGRKTEAGV